MKLSDLMKKTDESTSPNDYSDSEDSLTDDAENDAAQDLIDAVKKGDVEGTVLAFKALKSACEETYEGSENEEGSEL